MQPGVLIYSLRSKLLIAKMDVSRTKIHLDTSISVMSNSEWREYEIDATRKVMPSIHHVLCLPNFPLILFCCIHSVCFFLDKGCASLQEDYQA